MVVRKGHDPDVVPGFFEIFCGPMKSGKSRGLLYRVDRLQYRSDAPFIFFKPKVDKRDKVVSSRFGELTCECTFIGEPQEMLRYVLPEHRLVAIDEVNLFDPSITKVIRELLRKNLNVVAAGLDLDFRGETFGPMGELLALANYVEKIHGICEYKYGGRDNKCNALGTRTQRLFHGEPAHYNSDLVSIEGSAEGETYECRCLEHHFVPGKPKKRRIWNFRNFGRFTKE